MQPSNKILFSGRTLVLSSIYPIGENLAAEMIAKSSPVTFVYADRKKRTTTSLVWLKVQFHSSSLLSFWMTMQFKARVVSKVKLRMWSYNTPSPDGKVLQGLSLEDTIHRQGCSRGAFCLRCQMSWAGPAVYHTIWAISGTSYALQQKHWNWWLLQDCCNDYRFVIMQGGGQSHRGPWHAASASNEILHEQPWYG